MLGFGASVRAAIVPATSCNQADIQTAIDAAVTGDTVAIPAGACTWSLPVRLVNKGLTLQGAGMDQTVITDSTGNAWNEPALWIEGQEGQKIRVTGLGFHYAFNATLEDYNGAILVRGTSKEVRVDHCRFVDFWNRSMQFSGYTYGLIDHCVFQRTPGAVNWFQATNVNGDGDAAWQRPLTLGSANAVYIEENQFDFYDSGSAADSHSGGRFVFRVNTVRNGHMLNHGLDTTDRSSHSFEIYDNAFAEEAYTFNIITIRGGTGVIYRNTITSPASIDIPINGQLYRSCLDYPSSHGSRCNGTNPIDGNQDPSGYPCKDQHGRTTGQTWSPIYLWGNTFNAAAAVMRIHDPWHCTAPAMTDHLKDGRDFINGTPRPRYVPYPYPHPLILGDYPGQQRALQLVATSSANQVGLVWQAVTGAASYTVLRDWQQVAQTAAISWTDSGVIGEHVYMVYAYNAGGTLLAAEGALGVAAGTPTASGFHPVTPCRVLDTRVTDGATAAAPALAFGERRQFVIADTCGVPADAIAVSANLTVVGAPYAGELRVIGGHLSATSTCALAIPLARARANNAIIQLATDSSGAIAVTNDSPGAVHFILDVNGFFR